jgi:hypothetical protein
MKKMLFFIGGIVLVIYSFRSCSSGIPDNLKDRRLLDVVKNRNWIRINSDNTFVLHEEVFDVQVDAYGNLAGSKQIPFEWKGKIDGLKLIPDKPLYYKVPGRKSGGVRINQNLIYLKGDDRVGWKDGIQIQFIYDDGSTESQNYE